MTLIRRLYAPLGTLYACVCGSWYDPSDPASWQAHKHCQPTK